jgi:8-oxo-dGTP diphosphatase
MDTGPNYAVAIILETAQGIPLVMDPQKPVPRYWKFPGGRSEAGETPAATAVRELREEIGVSVQPEDLKVLREETRQGAGGEHKFFLFYGRASARGISNRGAGGEMVKLFPSDTIQNMPDFFPNHRALWDAFLANKRS